MKENAVVTCFFVLQSVLSSIHDIIYNIWINQNLHIYTSGAFNWYNFELSKKYVWENAAKNHNGKIAY